MTYFFYKLERIQGYSYNDVTLSHLRSHMLSWVGEKGVELHLARRELRITRILSYDVPQPVVSDRYWCTVNSCGDRELL
jgi:hypothetical protein